jgi:hypothetical protein
MPYDLDPASLTPDERLREIASVLARGILALRERAALPALGGPDSSPEKSLECMEVVLAESGEKSEGVHRG